MEMKNGSKNVLQRVYKWGASACLKWGAYVCLKQARIAHLYMLLEGHSG